MIAISSAGKQRLLKINFFTVTAHSSECFPGIYILDIQHLRDFILYKHYLAVLSYLQAS